MSDVTMLVNEEATGSQRGEIEEGLRQALTKLCRLLNETVAETGTLILHRDSHFSHRRAQTHTREFVCFATNNLEDIIQGDVTALNGLVDESRGLLEPWEHDECIVELKNQRKTDEGLPIYDWLLVWDHAPANVKNKLEECEELWDTIKNKLGLCVEYMDADDEEYSWNAYGTTEVTSWWRHLYTAETIVPSTPVLGMTWSVHDLDDPFTSNNRSSSEYVDSLRYWSDLTMGMRRNNH